MQRIFYFVIAFFFVLSCFAQNKAPHSLNRFDFNIKAGANIGGAAPMGIPAQIREIKSFNPLISLSIGANAAYWLVEKWGVSAGIRFENKSMTTTARVKEYEVRLVQGNGAVAGLFTGYVQTKMKNGYLTLPVAACYRLITQLTLHIGVCYSYLLDPSFVGSVYGGHLRRGEAGQEYNVDIPQNEPSPFVFSNELSKHDFGLAIGAEWNIIRHFIAAVDLNWGLTTIFPKSFTGMKIPLYNVYATFAFGYLF